MKRIVLLTLFTIVTATVAAQQKSSSHSKWKETKNGTTYQMDVKVIGSNAKDLTEPHLVLTASGDIKNLTKLSVTNGKGFQVTVPIAEGAKVITLSPGSYVFKVHHLHLGEQQFEVELTKGDEKKIVLTAN